MFKPIKDLTKSQKEIVATLEYLIGAKLVVTPAKRAYFNIYIEDMSPSTYVKAGTLQYKIIHFTMLHNLGVVARNGGDRLSFHQNEGVVLKNLPVENCK